MIGSRFHGTRPSASLGWVPNAAKCDDTVGQIQQAANAVFAAKKLGDKADLIDPVMPLAVDGRAGVSTLQVMDVLNPGWGMQFGPSTTLRQIREKYGAPPAGPAFSCAGGPATEPSIWDTLAQWAPAIAVAGGAVAIAYLAKGRAATAS